MRTVTTSSDLQRVTPQILPADDGEGDWVPSPISCLISAIGQHFREGVREALVAAGAEAVSQGYRIGFQVVRDVCIRPFEGLGAMRNMAILQALEERWDYVLLIDNDILMEDSSVLWRLLGWHRMALTPLLDQSRVHSDGLWERVASPMYRPFQGLQQLDWVQTGCLLLHRSALELVGPRFFSDPLIVREEEYLFRQLRLHGIRLWQDTDALVKMLESPTQLWKVIGGHNPLAPDETA